MNWTPIKKKKPSEQIQEYLDSQKPGGRVLNTPVNRIQPTPQFPGNTPLRQTATQRPFFAGPTEVIHAPKAPDTTVHQGGGTAPNVVVTPEKPKTYEWPNVDQQMADLELAQKQAHIAAFADQMAAMDAEFWRIVQNPGSMLGANESPYYSLYMKQYQQRARDRETNAYTRATAGTGGYGSSFATMAGDQAYRETLQEFDELAPTLIMSKSERMAEILQEREMLKAMKQERLKTESPMTMTLEDGTTVEVDDTNVQSAYEYIAAAMQNGGTIEQVENTIREGLKNQRTADGKAYTENEINAAIEKYKGVEKAAVADTQKNTGTVLDKGLGNAKELNAEDLITLGIDATAWGEMDEATRKTTLLEAAGQAKKDGRLSTEQYTRLLDNDVNTTLNAIRTGKVDKKATELAALAMDLEGYKDDGYLSEAEYTAIIDRMLAEIDPGELVAEQTRSLGEKITRTDDDESGLNEIIDIAITGGLGSVIGFGGPLLSAMMGSLASNNNFQKLIHFKKEERDMLAYLIGRKTAKEVTSKGAKGIRKK